MITVLKKEGGGVRRGMIMITDSMGFFTPSLIWHSDEQLVIFPTNRNMNRFVEPTSVEIGIGIVCESQFLRIGIGKIFVRWEVYAN